RVRLRARLAALLHRRVRAPARRAAGLVRIMSDVTIVGGGPAGATLALCLARLGHAVALVERRALSPPNAESLNPGIWPLLDTLGIGDAGALRIHRSLVRWNDDSIVEQRHPRAQLAVLRPDFDARLRELARTAGVTMHRELPPSGASILVDA